MFLPLYASPEILDRAVKIVIYIGFFLISLVKEITDTNYTIDKHKGRQDKFTALDILAFTRKEEAVFLIVRLRLVHERRTFLVTTKTFTYDSNRSFLVLVDNILYAFLYSLKLKWSSFSLFI